MKSLSDQLGKHEENLRSRVNEVNDRAQTELQAMRDALHRRPDKGGEWDTVAPEDRNIHQRLAARTWGILTLANVATASGALLTLNGMNDYRNGRYRTAALKMGIGRCLDLVDGVIATKTGTRSPVGAAADAGADKLLAAGFITIAAQRGDMSLTEAVVHGFQQGRILHESVLIKHAGGEPNPSRDGKYGMAGLWLRGGGIVLEPALREAGLDIAADITRVASDASMVGAQYYNQRAGNAYAEERLDLQSASQ